MGITFAGSGLVGVNQYDLGHVSMFFGAIEQRDLRRRRKRAEKGHSERTKEARTKNGSMPAQATGWDVEEVPKLGSARGKPKGVTIEFQSHAPGWNSKRVNMPAHLLMDHPFSGSYSTSSMSAPCVRLATLI